MVTSLHTYCKVYNDATFWIILNCSHIANIVLALIIISG